MEQINAFLDVYGIAAIFGILLIKSIGVPIPIPADAIMLVTAARAAEGRMVLWQAFVASLVALVIGSLIQFTMIRSLGRSLLYRIGPYLGLTPVRLDAVTAKVQKSGSFGISLAVVTPGVRSVVVIGSGLAGIPLRTFATGLTLGTTLFLALHFFLGYAGRMLLERLGISLGAALAILVAVLVVGFAGWFVIRRRRNPQASARTIASEALAAWHEATCPVCLALNAVSHLESPTIEPATEKV